MDVLPKDGFRVESKEKVDKYSIFLSQELSIQGQSTFFFILNLSGLDICNINWGMVIL